MSTFSLAFIITVAGINIEMIISESTILNPKTIGLIHIEIAESYYITMTNKQKSYGIADLICVKLPVAGPCHGLYIVIYTVRINKL